MVLLFNKKKRALIEAEACTLLRPLGVFAAVCLILRRINNLCHNKGGQLCLA